MRNNRLLPYETIVQAATGEPEAVNAVLQHYQRHTLFCPLLTDGWTKTQRDYITTDVTCRDIQVLFDE